MKTKLLLFTLLFSSKLFAIDRFVNPNLSSGNGTTLFTTIASAVTASANGDRILIIPGTYNEPTLTLSKSLTLLSQTAGSVINYNGNIIIAGFPGMKLEIIGFNLGIYSVSSNPISGGSASNRAKISIIDSKMKDLNMDQSFYESNIIKCRASDVTIFRFGNYIASKTNDLYLRDEPQINLQTNRNRIIADTVLNRLEIRNDDFPTLIANCLIKGLYFYKWQNLSSSKNSIRNNQFTTGSSLLFAISAPAYNIEFSSNHFLSQPVFLASAPCGTGHYNTEDCSPGCGCIGFGSANSAFPQPEIAGYFRWVYNGIDLPCTIPTGANPLVLTKIIGPVGTTVNSGDPNHDYYDIDLTVNDRGILGGPYSLLNYNPSINPSNGKAFIFDLEMPSDLFPGVQVDINAKGYHRN
jgi:hypothetical protein